MSLIGTSKRMLRRAPARRKITKAVARKLLGPIREDQGFSFYLGIDVPTGKYANSLQDFCQRLLEVEAQSVAFHLEREDLQNWLSEVVGDEELASKLSGLKGTGLPPEELRSKVYGAVKLRCDELSAALEKA